MTQVGSDKDCEAEVSPTHSLTLVPPMKIVCILFVVVCLDNPPATPLGATSDWDGSSKSVDTVITYTCDTAGPVTRAVCDAKTKTWIPSTIPSC